MLALQGIKVLDLTHALAGPFCTYQLQLLGAEVIKVERPGTGDDFRDFARPEGWDVGPSFIAVNGGKRSITVDLKQPRGVEIVRRLALTSDVVVENQRPRSLARMGLDWESLRRVNPRLVYCSVSGFGQTGALRDWLAYDHTIQAMSGMMWNGGDDIPTQGRGFSVDCFAGYVAYSSILASLLRRERSGEGQYLDVAMLDASMVLMAVGIVRQFVSGDQLSAIQAVVHERPTVAPYRTADRWLFLSGNFQNHFEALCRVLDAPELLADPRFRDVRSRNAHSAELKEELAARFAQRSAAVLERELMEAGCPAAVVRTTAEAVQLPHLQERQLLQPAEVPGAQTPVSLINAGFVADKDGPHLSGPVPELGQDTEAILKELGYTQTQISDLRVDGVI
ncbi:MAG: CoA transferase [Chloroflexi bacterium]|nr:CoA transferase [Chloroflexota bacterium]MBV9600810.1 CoA transferase [Chloroflexota bacterium]